MYKLTDTFVLILLIFAVFLSVAYTTLNKLFAVFLYIIVIIIIIIVSIKFVQKVLNKNTIKLNKMPCYRKDDRAMYPIIRYSTLILFTSTSTRLLCADLILNEFKQIAFSALIGCWFQVANNCVARWNFYSGLRKFCFFFCKSDVLAVQGHPKSLILVPVDSAHATFY